MDTALRVAAVVIGLIGCFYISGRSFGSCS